ncbi:MAG: hypothetical protein ACRECP_03840 [Methylocella sp.]
MPTQITINVKNNTQYNQNIFFFQKPADYTGGAQVYSNSLWSALLLPYATTGAVASFSVLLQYYAGINQQVSPPQVGQSSGQLAAIQAIGLTPASGGAPTNNTTTMIMDPGLGLTVPIYTAGPQEGSFRIISPVWAPGPKYNAGSAIPTTNGGITLSNFVTSQPNANLDCQPILKFYVQTGNYTPGTVMNFTESSATAALCDATPGYTSFDVSYNADGRWTVKPFALVKNALGALALIEASVAVNAEIKNEAGTAVICTGYAANFNVPVVVQNLSNPGVIHVHSEYQVGPTGGPYAGRMCTQLAGNAATFS